MWRPWDTESQEGQWDSSNDGIPIVADDSDNSVIFVAEKPVSPMQDQCIITRVAHRLPTFSNSASDTSSSLDEYLLHISS